MSYGANLVEDFRRTATYVNRIPNDANPGDLPIEQPAKLALRINMKTMKTLGLKVRSEQLLRADRMIE